MQAVLLSCRPMQRYVAESVSSDVLQRMPTPKGSLYVLIGFMICSPHSLRAWRASLAGPVEGAVFAETIPFNETRDYVKKVMSNSVYYAALAEDKAQSLKARLGVIAPKAAGTTELP